jgi:hypothetical protein
MRLKLISCEVFEREVRSAVVRSSNQIDVELLPESPHRLSDRDLTELVQSSVDRAERSDYQGVLLVAGSCKHGLTGLTARSVPLVLPRAKDCISLLLEHTPSVPSTFTDVLWKAPASRRGTHSLEGIERKRPRPRKSLMLAGDRRSFARNESWNWREAFNVSPKPKAAKAQPALGSGSILDMLVGGYWNHTDFLVVVPGWRVVVRQGQGTITSEEILP